MTNPNCLSRGLLVLLLGCVAGLGLAFGFLVPGWTNPVASIQFAPATIDLVNEFHVEGEAIDLVATLRNPSKRDVQVTRIPRSCACIAVAGPQDELTFPIPLGPGAERPIHLHLNTQGRPGVQSFFLTAFGTGDDGAELPPAGLTITARILGSLVVIPDALYVTASGAEGAPIRKQFLLADDWPGDGLEVESISATDPGRFQFELRRVDGSVAHLGGSLAKRYELDVVYRPDDQTEDFSETITIKPADARVKPSLVPFCGKIARPYELRPASLTFYGIGPGKRIERKLMYRYSDPLWEKVELAEAPAGFSVSVGPATSGARVIEVSCLLPDNPQKRMEEIVLKIGPVGEMLRLPVTVVLAPE